MEQGLYLYCLAWSSHLAARQLQGSGLDDRNPLEVLVYRELAAVWSLVPLADFCGPEAAARLRDLTWIGPRVIRHQRAVTWVMQHSPVLPTRFGTIFSSAASLEGLLRHSHDAIVRFLESLKDREEWAVKGMLDRSVAKERLFSLKLAQEAAGLETLTPGKRYFQEQRLRSAGEQELSRRLAEMSRELWSDLRELATEVRERRLLSREVTGSERDMVLNWAFLVPEAAVPHFQARIEAANARYGAWGLGLEATGPWPPYSFCPALELEPKT
jgi:hypothetical protein